jgi:hypothetical protein
MMPSSFSCRLQIVSFHIIGHIPTHHYFVTMPNGRRRRQISPRCFVVCVVCTVLLRDVFVWLHRSLFGLPVNKICLCGSRAINYAVILNSSPRMLSCISDYQVVTVVVSCVGNLIWQQLKTISQLHCALIVLSVEAGTCHLAADTQALIICI